jgi:hypothetical protein
MLMLPHLSGHPGSVIGRCAAAVTIVAGDMRKRRVIMAERWSCWSINGVHILMVD